MFYAIFALSVASSACAAKATTADWIVNTYTTSDCSNFATKGWTGSDVLREEDAFTIDSLFPQGTKALFFKDSVTAAHVLNIHSYSGEPRVGLLSTVDVNSTKSREVYLAPNQEGSCIPLAAIEEGFSLRPAPYSSTAVGTRLASSTGTALMALPANHMWEQAARDRVYKFYFAAVAACVAESAAGIFGLVTCGLGFVPALIETGFVIGASFTHYASQQGGSLPTRSLLGGDDLFPTDQPLIMSGYDAARTIRVHRLNISAPEARLDAEKLTARDLSGHHVFLDVEYVDKETGEVQEHVFADLDPETGDVITSAPVEAGDYGRIGDGLLSKRQESPTAHFWAYNVDTSINSHLFPMTRETSEHLAGSLWDWQRDNDIGGHCANLIAGGARVANGYFAIKTGPFTFHRDC